MGRLIAALMASVVAATVWPEKVAAAPPGPFRFVGDAAGPVATDSRYAAYAHDAANVRVLDTATGQARTVQNPLACSFRDVGGGQVMWSCRGAYSGRDDAHILELSTNAMTHVPLRTGASTTSIAATEVGAFWITGRTSGNHYSAVPFFQNWRDGRELFTSARDSPSVVRNLDAPELVQRLCEPLTRSVRPGWVEDSYGEMGEKYEPYQYEPPYGLRSPRRGGRARLILDRCGRGRGPILLSNRCRNPWQLLARRVTWSESNGVLAYDVRSRRTYRWRLDGIDRDADAGSRITHTAHHVFVSIRRRDNLPPPQWRIYSAPWP